MRKRVRVRKRALKYLWNNALSIYTVDGVVKGCHLEELAAIAGHLFGNCPLKFTALRRNQEGDFYVVAVSAMGRFDSWFGKKDVKKC